MWTTGGTENVTSTVAPSSDLPQNDAKKPASESIPAPITPNIAACQANPNPASAEPLPSQDPDAPDPAKEARLRTACIREIIQTEQAYLDDLKILEEVDSASFDFS